MIPSALIIAIDGYSSTGKSSFAKKVAAHLGLTYLDSGALYRAVTLYALEHGYIRNGKIDCEGLKEGMHNLEISFRKTASGASHTFIAGSDVEDKIRTMEVASFVSPIAELDFVRDYVDTLLHRYGEKGGIVMDGRDIGSTVFPNAEVKLFMTASEKVRAERRMKEMVAAGKKVTMDEVLANLRERDYIDSHRKVSPLRQPEDAVVLDNSEMDIEQEIEWLDKLLKDKFE